MNYKILLCCLILMQIGTTSLNAQYDNVWAFGDYAGVDFNTDPPQAIKTSIKTHEGCASIADSNGDLLIYTDGTSVWDRNHNIMPNSADLPDVGKNITSSTAQGALIVPVPGNTQQYYVFSLGMNEDTFFFGRLYYSIIDMSLNNGLGDVLPDKKGILIDSLLSEHMTAVSGNDCNIWLLVAPRKEHAFKVYNITSNGIDPNPTISNRIPGGGQHGGFLAMIDVSPNRNKLAMAQGNLILYDFDPQTGVITNPLILDSRVSPLYYGVCFSPESSKLYASAFYGELIQFELAIDNQDSILASRVKIADVAHGIKRGPDKKIYSTIQRTTALGIIHHPELQGAACNYERRGMPLLSGTQCQLGLPNSTTIVTNQQFYSASSETVYCEDSFLLEAKSPSGSDYVWNDGHSGVSRPVFQSGTYWVSYQVNSPCMVNDYVDTFKIIFDNSRKNIVKVTEYQGLCTLDTILLEANNLLGTDYLWSDSSTGKQLKVNQSGIYWLSYKIDSLCQDYVDSFKVTYPAKSYRVSFTADPFICKDAAVQFQNTSDPHFLQFSWSFGDNVTSAQKHPEHIYTDTGNYEVRLIGQINDRCMDTAYQTLIVDPIIETYFSKDQDSICVGESIAYTQEMDPTSIKNLHWQMGDGSSFSTFETSIKHAYDQSGIMSVRLRSQFRACPDTSFTDTIHVFELPKVDLGQNIGFCANGTPVLLRNLYGDNTSTGYHNLWSTGDTTAILKVTQPGIYHLTVSVEPLGCSVSESVTIAKDCYIDIPNAFSPDGDGRNDYFSPRQLLSKNVSRFSMQVLNRWGQLVFETTSINGRGWDGKLNNIEQPQGVYVYIIEAEINGHIERYEGNVTLLR